MIDPHTLETLEYDKVLTLIAGQCITPYGSANVAGLTPLTEIDIIRQRQAEIAEMRDIVTFGAAFPLYRMEDARELLEKSTVEGVFLDPEEIRTVLELVEVSIAIREYDEEGRENFPRVTEYIEQVRAFPEVRKEILKAIDERGEIKDSASSALKRIRLDIGDTRRKLIARLQSIIGSQKKHSGWQDDVVTQRNGRYVIPVVAGEYKADSGILHDRSQSGATLFIEPNETVETNNRLNLLMQQERIEIDRILRNLTREIALRYEALTTNIKVIGWLDAIHAAARFARNTRSHRPRMIDKPGFSLVDARHPLLLVQLKEADKVIPLDLELGESRQAVVVTGPNTGGKTIALKTIGLLVLMAQSGLLIPASDRSSVGLFEQVYADIGDEQSIELSLSTFSSHIRNIISALRGLSDKTLVLFDEIGAGTDPKEGAALAEAIILHCVESQAQVVATTHYSQLKTLPLQRPEIENASLEFDRETLAPTYRLQVGIPGSSYAVEIASRLGMPDDVCTHATGVIGSGERSLGDLIASLEGELRQVKQDKRELTDRLARAKELENYYRQQSEKLEKEADEEKQKALAETRLLLERARRETEKMVSEIRKSQASKGSVKQAHKRLKELEKTAGELVESTSKPAPVESVRFEVGDKVRVISLDQWGEIEALLDGKARVRVGNWTTTVEFRNLEQLGEKSTSLPSTTARSAVSYDHDNSISPEIHLRGMTVEEALESLEQYLDRARIAGLSQVYVIHGKGTGTLRRSLTEFLRKHPDVEDLRLGNWNEGGAGVTIAKLKS